MTHGRPPVPTAASLWRRLFAFAFDYLAIGGYIAVLWGVSTAFGAVGLAPEIAFGDPVRGQLMGGATMSWGISPLPPSVDPRLPLGTSGPTLPERAAVPADGWPDGEPRPHADGVAMRRMVGWIALAAMVALLLLAGTYLLDMRRAYDRVGTGTILSSPFGPIEFTQGGQGPPVLVIHGAGGGFDQGELLVEAVLGDGFHWITPSRFGYLGSAMPEGATWDDQADAWALVLDHLGIERAAVVALSQGGPSALLFALRHPDRVSSLTCLSCGVVGSSSEDQAEANEKGDLLRVVFSRDATYWPVSRFFRTQLMGVLGASKEVVANLTPEQRSIIDRLIVYMNPASSRSAGVILDNEAELPGERIAGITTPTLIVHARDDLLQLYHNGAFAAVTIPGATLLSFEAGGHVVVAVEREAIRDAVRAHIIAHHAAHPVAPPGSGDGSDPG